MHRGEAMNISLLIFNDIAQKEMFLNNLVIHHFIMLTIVSYEITFTLSVPKSINIAPL